MNFFYRKKLKRYELETVLHLQFFDEIFHWIQSTTVILDNVGASKIGSGSEV
jgi:hypothetical protein